MRKEIVQRLRQRVLELEKENRALHSQLEAKEDSITGERETIRSREEELNKTIAAYNELTSDVVALKAELNNEIAKLRLARDSFETKTNGILARIRKV